MTTWVSRCLPMLAACAAVSAFGQPAPAGLVKQYCSGCHNDKLKTAGVSFDGLDPARPELHAGVWERTLRKVRSGQMPPAGLPRPEPRLAAAFTDGLEQALDRAAGERPNPGRPAIRRLNRAEYDNVIRDLLALDIQPSAALPVDDSGYGFDNIGDVLSVSPAHLEKYLAVARRVSRLAVGDMRMKPSEEATPVGFRPRNERAGDDLPFNSSGGAAFRHYFPLDAEYTIRIKMPGESEDAATPRLVRMPVKAGLRTVGVAYIRESTKAEVVDPSARRGPPGRGALRSGPALLDVRLDGVRIERFEIPGAGPVPPQIDSVIVGGPYRPTGRGETASRARIFVCRPQAAAQETPCAQKILSTLARRAFRRPVDAADIRPLMAFYRAGRAGGDFDDGIQRALQAMLTAPSFLFRVERDPQGAAPGSAYRLADLDLASRLSFFLWSSIPDDELLDLAEKGRLHEPAVLGAQVRRMLDDPRSDALIGNFAGQWLELRNLANVKPDPDIFKEFDEPLRQAAARETQLLFRGIVREDRSVLELLDADYTYLNQRLAEHYGIRKVYGSQFRKVALDDSSRGGLLGQASILTITSYPNRTSVVQRGKWILENLLGAPPPPPPADVPELRPEASDGRRLTLREQMDRHRADATCASCHARMDPIGFALENYDGIGRWRDEEAGQKIDASGELPGGVSFVGPAGLKKLLLSEHRDEFLTTVAEKLMIYALGRGLEPYDQPALRSVLREAARENYRFSALVNAVIKSVPFQMRRTSEP
jgi:hypothetical protein